MDSLERHTDYGSVGLDASDLDPNPLAQFAGWLQDAENAGIYEPNAMVLGSVDTDGRPHSRTVLLKGLTLEHFEFVTNYRSDKGTQLAANPAVSLLFPWYSLNRQVIVIGSAARASAQESDALFAARPRESQLASLASEQSRAISSRAELEGAVERVTREHDGIDPVPRSEWWGGMRVIPDSVEFWQGRTSRVHDRLRYRRSGDEGEWVVERLQP